MGGCQSRKAAAEEAPYAAVSSPRLSLALLQQRLSPLPKTVTVIPDVDDDTDVEEAANLTSLSYDITGNHHHHFESPVSSPNRIAVHQESSGQVISPLSSLPEDDDIIERNQDKPELDVSTNNQQLLTLNTTPTKARCRRQPAWSASSPDLSIYTSSPSSNASASLSPASSKLRGIELLPPDTLQPRLLTPTAETTGAATNKLPLVFPIQKREASSNSSLASSKANERCHPLAAASAAPTIRSRPTRLALQQQTLRSMAARPPINMLPSFGKQNNDDGSDSDETSSDDGDGEMPQMQSIATLSPRVTATEIPEEEDPDAPSDEEEYHDEEEPGRLTIRTKYIASTPFSARQQSPTTHPARSQQATAADGDTAAVHPQTLSHFHRMALQQKLRQKQLNKQARADKLQERIQDVKSYKLLWKDFKTMQTEHSPSSPAKRPPLSLTPAEQRIAPDSGASKTRKVTARRSQRGVVRRSNSFTLGDASSWFFDFQGTDFAFEGKEKTAQSSLSLLSETSLEVQKRLFAQKRRSRKTSRIDSKNRARSVGCGQMSTTSSITSVGGDYGPARRRLPSLSGMSAPALCSGSSDVEITNIEVSFSSPRNARDRHGDDVSCISDLADDVSASQLRSFIGNDTGPMRRTKDYGPLKKSTADALSKIEKRLQELKRKDHVDPPSIDAHKAVTSPSDDGVRSLTAESPIVAALLVDKFQAAATDGGSSAASPVMIKRVNDRISSANRPWREVDGSIRLKVVSPVAQGRTLDQDVRSTHDETPRIKNKTGASTHSMSHVVSPEPLAKIQDSFEELGQHVENSLLENILDESTIALLDDSASIGSKLADTTTDQKNHDQEEPMDMPPLPNADRIPGLSQSSRRAPGSIATMSTEEFLLISEEANLEKQARNEIHVQMRESLSRIRKVSGLDVSSDESADELVVVTPEKERPADKSMDSTEKVALLEKLAEERVRNRMSLAHLRGFEDPSLTESSLLLAEKVEAKVQDVLCKYRGETGQLT